MMKACVYSIHPTGKSGISLITRTAEQQVHSLETKGLCMARFKADCIVEGMDFDAIKVGDRLRIGEMTMEVTRSGKVCHGSECSIFEAGKTCFMTKAILFGETVVEGSYKVGDRVKVIQ